MQENCKKKFNWSQHCCTKFTHNWNHTNFLTL